MNQTTKPEDFSKTLTLCEEIKDKIEELQLQLLRTTNQGLLSKYKENANNLINWIEEIEFNITLPEYEQN